MTYAQRQLLFGLLFLAIGFCFLYFGYPNKVVFNCDRGENICTLTRSGFLRSKEIQIPLTDLTGAELQTAGGKGGKSSMRLWVTTRKGPIPFTACGIGGNREKKTEMVSAIQDYVADNQASTLTVVQDERLPFFLTSAGFAGFGLLVLVTGLVKIIKGDRT
jgi:hypothetical protein